MNLWFCAHAFFQSILSRAVAFPHFHLEDLVCMSMFEAQPEAVQSGVRGLLTTLKLSACPFSKLGEWWLCKHCRHILQTISLMSELAWVAYSSGRYCALKQAQRSFKSSIQERWFQFMKVRLWGFFIPPVFCACANMELHETPICVLICDTQIELSAFSLQSFLTDRWEKKKNRKALNLATFKPSVLLWWFRFAFGNAERRSCCSRRKRRLSIFPVGFHSTPIFVSVLAVIHVTNAFVHFSLSATIAQVIN